MQLPGERLLIKLLEVLASGVGTGTRPWMMRREARAKALGKADAARIERLAQEKLRQEIKDVRAGRKTISADYIVIDAEVEGKESQKELQRVGSEYLKALRATLGSPGQLIELERQINFEQISSMVIEEAETHSGSEPDDKPIDPDWFVQWRNRAQDVSSEDMQRLWARVLKGQAAVSGSYSIHTMEFLGRMSRVDAELIAKLGCFALDDAAVYSGSEVLQSVGLDFDRLLYLSDLGIISGVSGFGGLSWNIHFTDRPDGLSGFARVRGKGLLFKAKDAGQKVLSVPAYPISVLGRELLALAECEANLDYLKDIADRFRGECGGVFVGDASLGAKPGEVKFSILGPI